MNLSIERVVNYDNVSYKVLDETSNGFLLCIKESDIEEGLHPFQVHALLIEKISE